MDFGLTYPFPPNVQKAISGDFVRLHLTLDLDAPTILSNLLAKGGPSPSVPLPSLPPLPLPSLPPLPLPSLPPLPVPSLPSALPSLPSLPLPSLPPLHLGVADPSTGEVTLVRGGLDALLSGGAA